MFPIQLCRTSLLRSNTLIQRFTSTNTSIPVTSTAAPEKRPHKPKPNLSYVESAAPCEMFFAQEVKVVKTEPVKSEPANIMTKTCKNPSEERPSSAPPLEKANKLEESMKILSEYKAGKAFLFAKNLVERDPVTMEQVKSITTEDVFRQLDVGYNNLHGKVTKFLASERYAHMKEFTICFAVVSGHYLAVFASKVPAWSKVVLENGKTYVVQMQNNFSSKNPKRKMVEVKTFSEKMKEEMKKADEAKKK